MRRIPDESVISVAADRKWLAAEEYSAWLDAGALLVEARRQVEDLRARAAQLYEAERERGYREGKEAAASEWTEQRVRWAAETIKALHSLERVVVQLVLDGIRTLLGEATEEQKVVALVRKALQAVRKEQKVTVRVAPFNVETIRRRAAELAGQAGVALEVVPDPTVAASACLLETSTGFVEADLENQVRSIRRALHLAMGIAEKPESQPNA